MNSIALKLKLVCFTRKANETRQVVIKSKKTKKCS